MPEPLEMLWEISSIRALWGGSKVYFFLIDSKLYLIELRTNPIRIQLYLLYFMQTNLFGLDMKMRLTQIRLNGFVDGVLYLKQLAGFSCSSALQLLEWFDADGAGDKVSLGSGLVGWGDVDAVAFYCEGLLWGAGGRGLLVLVHMLGWYNEWFIRFFINLSCFCQYNNWFFPYSFQNNTNSKFEINEWLIDNHHI